MGDGGGGASSSNEPDANDRLYVKGFPSSFTEDMIKQAFNNYGTVVSMRVTEFPGNPCKSAMARLSSVQEAMYVKSCMNGLQLEGSSQPIVAKFADKRYGDSKGKGNSKQGGCMMQGGWNATGGGYNPHGGGYGYGCNGADAS